MSICESLLPANSMKLNLDNDTLHLLPVEREHDPLRADERTRAERLRDWCLVWFIAAIMGWGLCLWLVCNWPE